jgi:hypothetical protein
MAEISRTLLIVRSLIPCARLAMYMYLRTNRGFLGIKPLSVAINGDQPTEKPSNSTMYGTKLAPPVFFGSTQATRTMTLPPSSRNSIDKGQETLARISSATAKRQANHDEDGEHLASEIDAFRDNKTR